MMKIIIIFGIALGIILIGITGIQFYESRVAPQSCGGDFSYNTRCPVGTYCKSLNEHPLGGGLCASYLSYILDIFSASR